MKTNATKPIGLFFLVVLSALPPGRASTGPTRPDLLLARQAYQEGLYLQRSAGDLPGAIQNYQRAQRSAIRAGADRLVESILLRKAECFRLLGRTAEQQSAVARLRNQAGLRDAPLGQALFFPPENEIVFQINLKAFLSSELLKSLNIKSQIRIDELEQAKALLGIDPLEDLHRMTVGISLAENQDPPVGNWLILTEGNLAGFKLDAVIRQQLEKDPPVKIKTVNIHGTPVHLFKAPVPGACCPTRVGVAQPDQNGLLVGDARSVRAFLAARAGKTAGLRANPKLGHVARRVPEGTTFWLAAVPERVVAKVKDLQGIPGLKNLPKLQGMLLTGRVGRDFTLFGLAWAQDDETARMLGDIVRGLVALIQFIPVEDPVAKRLLKSLRVQTEHRQVTVSATLSGELLARRARGQGDLPGGPVEVRVTGGRLTIESPDSLTVFLDGQRIGKTPMKRHKLGAGEHLLRLTDPAGKKVLAVKLKDKKDVVIIRNLPGGHELNLELPDLPFPPVAPLPPGDTKPPHPPPPPRPVEPVEPLAPPEPVGPH